MRHKRDLNDLVEAIENPCIFSPRHMDLLFSFDSLEAEINQVIVLVKQLAWDHHEYQNEIIAFMDNLQHIQCKMLDQMVSPNHGNKCMLE